VVVLLGLVLLLRGPSTRDRRNQVRNASERFAIALSSYDYRHLDADFAHVRSMSTTGFQAEFDDLLGGQEFVNALRTSQARSAATIVKGPYVASLARDEARTYTVVEQRITNKQSTKSRVSTSRVDLYLVRLGHGGWKVDRVTLS